MAHGLWIVSGSDLYTGQVMYLNMINSDQSQWVYQLDQVRPLNKQESQIALQRARVDHQKNRVVDPYLIQVREIGQLQETEQGSISTEPLKKREKMRITGPTVRSDLEPFPPR